MFKLFLFSFLLIPGSNLASLSKESSTINSLSNLKESNITPIITKENDKFFYHFETRMNGELEYTPFSYVEKDGYYELKNDLSQNNEITEDNFNETKNLIYIHYPKTYRFEDNRFSYAERTHKADREFYTTYEFSYSCGEFKYCLNTSSFKESYIKTASANEGSSEKITYTLESQKSKFIKSVVNFFSKNFYYKSNEVQFNLSNYVNLLGYENKLVSFSNRIPLNNIYYWYQGLYPNSDNENNSIYTTYAFNTYNDANNIISNRYYEIFTSSENSHSSNSAYSVNGYTDELIYCNKKYRNIKLYEGYLSKKTLTKNEFYLVRLPGSYQDPVAILKEWVPENYTLETYIKEIIRYYLIENQVINKCNYLTPISSRAIEYKNNHIYDKDTYFLEKLDIADIKKNLSSNIGYTFVSVTHKIINSNGTFKMATSNFQNEKEISFSNYGYYKVVENNFYGSKTLNDIIIKSDDRKLLSIKSENEYIKDDLLNNPSNQIFLTNKTNNDIELSFPYFDSSLIIIKHNGVEKELFNYVDYSLTTPDSAITFPKYKINEIGSYIITISNRFGLSNTIKLNISNSKTDIKVDASNDKFVLEINTPDGGLNSIASFYLKRSFYKKEESTKQYEEIPSSTPYIFEDVKENTSYVSSSKSNEDFLLKNVFTFYPKIEENTFYQIIKLYLKDSYGNIIDITYKWYYLVENLPKTSENSNNIEVIFDSDTIEINKSINYSITKDSNLSFNDYEIIFLSGENNLVISKEEKKISGIKAGISEIRFIFYNDTNRISKDYRLSVINNTTSASKNENNTKNSKNKYIMYGLIGGGVLILGVALVKIINKKKGK